VELTPAGLGRVDVRIEIGAHGRLTAAMMVDNPQAASELRARAAELERALQQAGFDLAGGLSFDVADQRGHARHQHDDQRPAGQAFRATAFQAALDNAGAADTAASGLLRLRRGVNAGVDVRI
jgi:flagellar hook-length control protein FliK